MKMMVMSAVAIVSTAVCAPYAPAYAANCGAAVPGSWNWSFGRSPGSPPVASGASVAFKPDGTMTWRNKSGHWSCQGTTVTLNWESGGESSTDTMTLSDDERSMIGTNNKGMNVRGER